MQIQAAEQQHQLEIQSARQQQQIELQKAYHDQTTQLRQQQLAQTKQKVDLATAQAAQRFQAQQQYRQMLSQGVDPAQALMQIGPQMGMSGAGMAALARPRGGEPVWVPPDVQSGAPGYFKTPTGAVHVPAMSHEPGKLGERDILTTLRAREKELAADPMLNRPIPAKATAAVKKELQDKKDEFQKVRNRIDDMISGKSTGTAPARRGTIQRIWKDDQGRKWRYKGDNHNPKADEDPNNWEEVK